MEKAPEYIQMTPEFASYMKEFDDGTEEFMNEAISFILEYSDEPYNYSIDLVGDILRKKRDNDSLTQRDGI